MIWNLLSGVMCVLAVFSCLSTIRLRQSLGLRTTSLQVLACVCAVLALLNVGLVIYRVLQ